MKRISYYIFTLLSCFGLALQSCTDEIQYPDGNGNETLPKGITLRIPDPQGLAATRADADFADVAENLSESKIYSLWLLAFPKGNGNTPIIKKLTDETKLNSDPISGHTAQGFQDFTLTEDFKVGGSLQADTYDVYVVANLDQYIDDPDLNAFNGKTAAYFEENLKLDYFNGNDYLLAKSEVAKENHGLPMACVPAQIQYKTEANGIYKTGSSGVKVEAGKDMVIHADLTILASKVRYTVLFDATANTGFSSTVFNGLSFAVDGVTASGVNADGATIAAANQSTSPKTLGSLQNVEYGFPTDVTAYPSTPYEALPAKPASPFAKRAFQGTVYLPANSSTGDKQTALNFAAHAVKTDGSKGHDLNYKLPLVPKANDYMQTDGTLDPGCYYDIVTKVVGVDKLEVQKFEIYPWQTENLLYELMLPCYLDVDQTEVDMIAGKTTVIEYTTNAETVSIQSPEYNGIPFFVIDNTEPEGGKLKIVVNSAIDADDYASINKDNYKYFYITAGQVHKKIDINNLVLQRFLTVSPQDITIDARERIASYDYGGKYFDIEINTNISSFTLSTTNWKEGQNSDCLYIVNLDNPSVKYWTANNNTIPINKVGTTILRVYYNNLNKSGVTYWDTDHSMKFEVAVINTVDHGEGYVAPVDVTVNTYSKTDNYTIYLHKPDSGWENAPHIYIYQCLEFPGNQGTVPVIWDNGTKYENFNLSNYPIGYTDGTNQFASLEYLFSGDLSFKGWDDPGNKPYLKHDYYLNGTNYGVDNGYLAGGFFHFHGNSSQSCEWAPKGTNSDRHYTRDIDFTKAHRDLLASKNQLDCDCKNGATTDWPGVRMMEVTDRNDPNYGWWKFELTSIATPGKTLIMFASGHSGDYPKNNRWPEDSKVGIALFDHPNRIGYYHMNNKYWTTTRDGVQTVTYRRIYFDNSSANFSTPYIYMWGSGSPKENSGWPGVKMSKDAASGLYYYDVPSNANWTGLIFSDNGNNNTKSGNLTYDLTKNKYNKTGAIGNYNGGDNPTPDTPEHPSEFTVGKKFAILFSGTYKIWCWTNNGNGEQDSDNVQTFTSDWPGPECSGSYVFTPSVAGGKRMGVHFGGDNSNKHWTPASSFTWNATNNRYEYTITP